MGWWGLRPARTTNLKRGSQIDMEMIAMVMGLLIKRVERSAEAF